MLANAEPDQQVGGDRAEHRLRVDDPPAHQVTDDRERRHHIQDAARDENQRQRLLAVPGRGADDRRSSAATRATPATRRTDRRARDVRRANHTVATWTRSTTGADHSFRTATDNPYVGADQQQDKPVAVDRHERGQEPVDGTLVGTRLPERVGRSGSLDGGVTGRSLGGRRRGQESACGRRDAAVTDIVPSGGDVGRQGPIASGGRTDVARLVALGLAALAVSLAVGRVIPALSDAFQGLFSASGWASPCSPSRSPCTGRAASGE